MSTYLRVAGTDPPEEVVPHPETRMFPVVGDVVGEDCWSVVVLVDNDSGNAQGLFSARDLASAEFSSDGDDLDVSWLIMFNTMSYCADE